jgi:hypothetical protein
MSGCQFHGMGRMRDYGNGPENYHSDSSRPRDGPPPQIAWQQTITRESIGGTSILRHASELNFLRNDAKAKRLAALWIRSEISCVVSGACCFYCARREMLAKR